MSRIMATVLLLDHGVKSVLSSYSNRMYGEVSHVISTLLKNVQRKEALLETTDRSRAEGDEIW